MQGYIHSVETGGTVDGPGVRFVVFSTGCPLACQYCHNPDTRKMKDGKLVNVADLLNEIAQYQGFFKRTGGGVTVSGGEPLCQPDFVTELFKGCKALGIHTALDTSGFLGAKATDELLSLTDLVLLDIKSGLSQTYTEVTGAELQPTLDFANRLAAMGKPVWVRFVLVPGLTDAAENIEAVARFVAPLPNVERVEVLPFHQMGAYKWQQMGVPYLLEDTPSPLPEAVAAARAVFAAKGLTVY